MARLMDAMMHYQGRRLFSTLNLKLSSFRVYDLSPPMLEKVEMENPWECKINIKNLTVYPTGTTIHYTTNGSEPNKDSAILTNGITISENCTIRALAICPEGKIERVSADVGELIIDDLRAAIPQIQLWEVSNDG